MLKNLAIALLTAGFLLVLNFPIVKSQDTSRSRLKEIEKTFARYDNEKVLVVYEYRIALRHQITSFTEKMLNEQGAQGWELVAVDGDRLYLKRKTVDCQGSK